ncbi:hypothetical protein RHO14_03275 [Orbus wheelerorum]|uniref:hypothetical protein n=1 Tax=Orbus wheelerorum TaxID=3074111 RepID=UPI00370DD662
MSIKCMCDNKECNRFFTADPDVICPFCNKKQKIIKNMINSFLFAGAIVVGGYQINNWISHDRYPTDIEYSLINRCLNDGKYISEKIYKQKFKLCVSALEKTIEDISYPTYKNNLTKFNITFEKNFQEYKTK